MALVSGGRSRCASWVDSSEDVVVLDDSAEQHFQTWFGMVRPQFFVVDSATETFVDVRPSTSCGQCGSWDDAYYEGVLRPFTAGGGAADDPAAENAAEPVPAGLAVAALAAAAAAAVLLGYA